MPNVRFERMFANSVLKSEKAHSFGNCRGRSNHEQLRLSRRGLIPLAQPLLSPCNLLCPLLDL